MPDTLNEAGQWVPAIPEPFYTNLIGYQCGCQRRLWTKQQYLEHYAYEHIYLGRPA